MNLRDLPPLFQPASGRVIHMMRGDAPGAWSGIGEPKIVWHTTETTGLPRYDRDNDGLDAELAPHVTYFPNTRYWIQDYAMNRPSESIWTYDDDSVFQAEIICYSARPIADASVHRRWVGDLQPHHYADLAELPNWLNAHGVDIPNVWPEKQALSYSQANAPGFRLAEDVFHDFNGHLGHQHVPYGRSSQGGNRHWDPGALDWGALMNAIEDDMPSPKDWDADDWDAFSQYLQGEETSNSPFQLAIHSTFVGRSGLKMAEMIQATYNNVKQLLAR